MCVAVVDPEEGLSPFSPSLPMIGVLGEGGGLVLGRMTSGHLKSRRENKDFGPCQNAGVSERFEGQKYTCWAVFSFKH